MFKKIYIEITNGCNLNCSFCMHNHRELKYMSIKEFETILDKIKGYTEYVYLHVLGEPLLHPDVLKMIDLANIKGYKVNITTNGYLFNKIYKNNNIRQINISLHSYIDNKGKTLEEYMNDIFNYVNNLDNTYISYRLWVNSKYKREIIDILNKEYNSNCSLEDKKYKFKDNIFLEVDKEFIWPINSNNYKEVGTCYALRDHIGILSNGDIVPCCLDGDGKIVLGNIFKDNMDSIINSSRYQRMLKGFKNNKKIEELCKKCNFIDK